MVSPGIPAGKGPHWPFGGSGAAGAVGRTLGTLQQGAAAFYPEGVSMCRWQMGNISHPGASDMWGLKALQQGPPRAQQDTEQQSPAQS